MGQLLPWRLLVVLVRLVVGFSFFEVSASEANVSSCGGHAGVARLEVDSYTGRSASLCAI